MTTMITCLPPLPPPRPVPLVPARYQGIRNHLVQSFLQGDEKAFNTTLTSVPLTDEQTRSLLNHNFEELQNHTFLYYAAMKNRTELCKTLFGKGADSSLESAYTLAHKKGGEVFAAFEPKLLGKLLNVGDCTVCEERAPLFPFECGHIFCYNCCRSWAKECINRRAAPYCPQAKCMEKIPINSLQQILPQPEFQSYLDTLLRSLLSSMEDFSWCPICSSGVISINGKDCPLCCPDCGISWCAKCSLISHGVVSCEEAKKNRVIEDNLNSTWKTQNTKQCPKCKVYIEKSAGCSHMSCKYCNYEFCWICLGPYKEGRRTFNNICPCK